FMYGNMFKDEYEPYKNYRVPKIIANNERERLLLEIYENDFALNDLSLYLDLHPEDEQVYKLFKVYTEKENKLVSEYERKYGPLNLTESNYDNYMWYKGEWPFEGVDL
ncbi:MAG: spore coat protein CotJB, partial [Clostridia bacterium]|nr:spore coat protein CotJB [Clostridia bacterium]